MAPTDRFLHTNWTTKIENGDFISSGTKKRTRTVACQVIVKDSSISIDAKCMLVLWFEVQLIIILKGRTNQ